MAIKRLHYFDHQFLVEADFSDEQKYHLDMRRRLNRSLYTFGIAEGLVVVKSGDKRVTVRSGVALDRFGREMIVESDQVVDLSNAEAFPAGTTVYITLAYEEKESDPSTATGAPGNTRIVEQAVVQAGTATPPSDGTVVRLAGLKLDASANVPGNINDPFDGGMRQIIGPRSERGLVSLEGVSNPGGNIDLVPEQAIVIRPNDTTNRIIIGENHSTETGNVHGLTAANLQQIGALLASDYELGKRAHVPMSFSELDANGAMRTLTVGFQPRIVLVVGTCSATMGVLRPYGGGVSAFFFVDLEGNIQQCFGFGVTKYSNTDWFCGPVAGDGICTSTFFNHDVNPLQRENLTVRISEVTENGLTATLTREKRPFFGIPVDQIDPLDDFTITLNLLCMG